jgi:hypothetical protein
MGYGLGCGPKQEYKRDLRQRKKLERIKVGINYPWGQYGWDFGASLWNKDKWGHRTWPRGECRCDKSNTYLEDWRIKVRRHIEELSNLKIFAIRWFILGDGFNYGISNDAPGRDANRPQEWRFDPPSLKASPYDKILEDFAWLLETLAPYDMKLVPSLIDYLWCKPGTDHQMKPAEVPQGYVRGGRSDVVTDYAGMRNRFLDRVLVPFLDASKSHRDTILAWELINEPEWAKVPIDSMKAFIKEGVGRINSAGFKSTIGMAKAETLKDGKWDYFQLGITLHQFHHYPDNKYPLPEHTFDKRWPCFVGEFATNEKTDRWPELRGSQGVYSRLKLIEEKGYPFAFPWSSYGCDRHTGDWSGVTRGEIRRYTLGKGPKV